MALDKSLCNFIAKIRQDPLRTVENLTVGKFYALQEHLKECETCADIVDQVTEEYKDVPGDPNSEWNKSQYN